MSAELIIPSDETLDAFATVHRRSVAAANGFDEILDRTKPELAAAARRLHDMHRRHAAELADALVRAGRKPDAAGGFMSTVHRTIVMAWDLVSDVDSDMLPRIKSGERAMAEVFEDAIRETPEPEPSAILERMRGEILREAARL